MTNGFRNALLVYAFVQCLCDLVMVIVGIGDERSKPMPLDAVWRHPTRSDQRLDNRYRDLATLHEREFLHTKQVRSRLRSLDHLRAFVDFLQAQAESSVAHVVVVLGFFQDGTEKCLDSDSELFVCTKSAWASKYRVRRLLTRYIAAFLADSEERGNAAVLCCLGQDILTTEVGKRRQSS